MITIRPVYPDQIYSPYSIPWRSAWGIFADGVLVAVTRAYPSKAMK